MPRPPTKPKDKWGYIPVSKSERNIIQDDIEDTYNLPEELGLNFNAEQLKQYQPWRRKLNTFLMFGSASTSRLTAEGWQNWPRKPPDIMTSALNSTWARISGLNRIGRRSTRFLLPRLLRFHGKIWHER